MRVIAGTARRIQLETVKGNNTRPTKQQKLLKFLVKLC